MLSAAEYVLNKQNDVYKPFCKKSKHKYMYMKRKKKYVNLTHTNTYIICLSLSSSAIIYEVLVSIRNPAFFRVAGVYLSLTHATLFRSTSPYEGFSL